MSEETSVDADKKQSEFFREVNIGEQIHDNTQPPSQAGKAEEFNPEIHCKNPDGSPRRNRDGSFRRKPIQKGAGGNAEKVEAVLEPMDEFNAPAPLSTVQMVEMLMGLSTLLAVKTFGDEWQFTGDERKMLTDVYARYMHYKGWDMEASPELVVFATTFAVLLPRIMSPNFAAWLNKNIFRKKTDAHANNRTDGNGENNSGENHSPTGSGNGSGINSVRPPIERMG